MQARFGISFVATVGLFCALAVSGCAKAQREIRDISCHYIFRNVERKEDQERIDEIIRAAAKGNIRVTGSATNPEYLFVVNDLKVIDRIHPAILYRNSWARTRDLYQVFNPLDPRFQMTYTTIDINAEMEVVVRFRITPGARLFYKPQGKSEKDITHMVDSRGRVSLKATIHREQEYIYARTVEEKVERYIKIDVYSQKVLDIDKKDYPL